MNFYASTYNCTKLKNMIFNCHYVKGFIIGILYVYLIIGIYKNSLELSQIIRKKQRIKRLSLNMNKVISISFIHSLNIIYQINKLILPSVRILWYIRHEITRGVNMYISWVRIYVNSWRQIREISSYFVMYNKIR